MSAGKFFAGFLVGGAIGAIAGILLAPKSGEETRADIARTSKELYSKAENSVKDLQAKTDEVISGLQQKGEDIINKVQSVINKQKEGQEG